MFIPFYYFFTIISSKIDHVTQFYFQAELQELKKASKIKGLQAPDKLYLQQKRNIPRKGRPMETMGGLCV